MLNGGDKVDQELLNARVRGMREAADYVDCNWSDARTMASHLRDVADLKKPLYQD